jgi:hypothetical protein
MAFSIVVWDFVTCIRLCLVSSDQTKLVVINLLLCLIERMSFVMSVPYIEMGFNVA